MLNRRMILILLLLLLVTAAACNFSAPFNIIRTISNMLPSAAALAEMEASPTLIPTTSPIPEAQIYQINRTEESEDGTYTINVTYPELNNADDAGENFNYMVEQLTQSQLDYFKANSAQNADASEASSASYYTLNFNLYRQDNRFISLLMIEDVYFAGAAHPGRHHYALNYSLTEARFYELADLFYDGSPFIYLLSEIAYDELTYQYGEKNIFAAGLNPIPDNFSRWNITPNGLLFTFEEYQVLPYALGSPQIMISYAALKNFIDPAGPLGSYIPADELGF